MGNVETLRDFYGRILGYVETDSLTGDKTGRDFYQRIVGYYKKQRNVTLDFYKREVSKGDILVSLILMGNTK